MKNIINTILGAAILISVGCTSEKKEETSDEVVETVVVVEQDNYLTQEEKDAGWRLLFDGQTTEGWRGFNESVIPTAWVVEEGTLKSLGAGGDLGGDIVYDEAFGEFELSVEWKISEGGNSGIFYHVVEGDQYKAAYETAPEYQVVDDLGFPEKLEEWQSLGADYAMYSADPATKKVKPAGEWNTSRIIFMNDHVEYWLNGQKTVEFTPWSDDWLERRNSGKWEDMPDYGKAKEGLIGLQDHGSFIWYKNIKIRKIEL